MSNPYEAALAEYLRAKEYFDDMVAACQRAETAYIEAALREDRLRRQSEELSAEHRVYLLKKGLNPTTSQPLSTIVAQQEVAEAKSLTCEMYAALEKLSREAGRAKENLDAAQQNLKRETAKRMADDGLDLVHSIEALLQQIEPLQRELTNFAAAFTSDLGGASQPYALPYQAIRQVTEILAKLPPLPRQLPTVEAAARDAWRDKYQLLAGMKVQSPALEKIA